MPRLGNMTEVPDLQWPSALAATHKWSPFTIHSHPHMLTIHDKSHKIWSKTHDSEALIVTDLRGRRGGEVLPINAVITAKVPHPPHIAKFPLEKTVFPDKLSFEDDLLKQNLISGSCRIL